MTFREKAIQYLTERGPTQDEAERILERAMADPMNEVMEGRWDDGVTSLPSAAVRLLHNALDVAAVEWIDANCPQAWFKPLFAGEEAASGL